MLLASFTSDLYEMGTFSRAPGRGGGGTSGGMCIDQAVQPEARSNCPDIIRESRSTDI